MFRDNDMRWFFSIAILFFGVITIDEGYLKWNVISLSLFCLPLLTQFTKYKDLHIYAIWLGLFVVIQSLISPVLIDRDYKTLQPNMQQVVDVKSGYFGISGKQTITTDSKGFRTTKNIDYKNNSSFRIFAIGGSTTEQIYLDDKNTWTHLLQESLQKETNVNVEVINTGVSGLKSNHHLATLRKIIGMHPDMVVFLVGINDWNWHITEEFNLEKEALKSKYSSKYLVFRETLLGNAINLGFMYVKSYGKHKKNSVKEDNGEFLVKHGRSLKRSNVHTFNPKTVHYKYSENLNEISDICKRNKIKCLFVNQPVGYQKDASENFKNKFWMTPPYKDYTLKLDNMIDIASLYNTYLIHFANENDHFACDAAPKLVSTKDTFYDDCHFNTMGANKMSKVVKECVSNITDFDFK